MDRYAKVIFTAFSTIITVMLGGWDMALQVLVTMLALDYLTGLAKAFCVKNLSSEIGAKGIVKKVMILAIIVLASQIDRLMGTQSQLVRTAVIYFYVANEGISILENLSAIGIPMPQQLREKLLQVRGKDNNANNKNNVEI